MSKKLEIIWKSPESLTPYVKNTKVHSVEQIDKIAGQISAFGFDQPIVVDASGVIIKGHGRREAAIRLGLQEVPVVVSSLDEYQAMAARIGDNKVAEAPWDNDLLKFEFGTLENQAFNLDLTGFSIPEIEALSTAWDSDPSVLDGIQETADPARAVIKVKCSMDKEDHIKLIIVEALRAADVLMETEIL